MRVDDERHVVWTHPACGELFEQTRRTVDAKVALLLVVELRARTGLHQHDVGAVADEQAVHVHGVAIELVRRLLLLPEHLRHDAEHRTAIESEDAIGEDLDLEATETHARQYGEPWTTHGVSGDRWPRRTSRARRTHAARTSTRSSRSRTRDPTRSRSTWDVASGTRSGGSRHACGSPWARMPPTACSRARARCWPA